MRKFTVAAFAVLLLVSVLLTGTTAFAATPANDFDKTAVLDDLNGSTIDGKAFNLADYPKSDRREPRLLQFAEFAFSESAEYSQYYGLYLYLYNPSGKSITAGTVQLATEYKNGEPSKYEKLTLTICSVSSDNVFYKFKVANSKSVYNRVKANASKRQYDVSGIEVKFANAVNATDYEIGGKFVYTGFSAGMSDASEKASTLNCTVTPLQTVVLDDLHFTYKRFWQNAAWADQLTSVYFSVDKEIADSYDKLYSIQAEVWKYLTSPMFVIYDNFYIATNDPFIDYLGTYANLEKQKGIEQEKAKQPLYWLEGFNAYGDKGIGSEERYLTTLAWLFKTNGNVGLTDFSVKSEELLRYMQDYSEDYGKEILGKYSKQLFADHYYYVDGEAYVNGYCPIDLDISGEKDFTLVGSSNKFDFWKMLFGDNQWSDDMDGISPIVEITYANVRSKSDEQISNEYFVAKEDAAEFKQYLKDNQDKVTYLFRFSLDDYFTAEITTKYGIGTNSMVMGYMAQQVAFLDFDIISLGYMSSDAEIHTIPVVNSPKDYIAKLESGTTKLPEQIPEWVFYILLGLAIVIALLFIPTVSTALFFVGKLVFFILKWLFKGIWWIISAPFKLIAKKVKKKGD